MTTFLTIISGVIVFVFCEYIREVWLSPLQEYKKIKQEISYALVFYANLYANPQFWPEASDQAQTHYNEGAAKMRELAGRVTGFAEIIPKLHLGMPSISDIMEASHQLIFLSNSFYFYDKDDLSDHCKDNTEAANKIKSILKLKNEKR